jgi:serine/threonine protein kinase
MHERGYYHRDIKPHNILCFNSTTMDVRITDFGLACPIASEKMVLKKKCGTPGYVDPAILLSK